MVRSNKKLGAHRSRHSVRNEAMSRRVIQIVWVFIAVERKALDSYKITFRAFSAICGSFDLLSAKAAMKPKTVMKPAKSCAASNASGIIVSASIARIAPAAIAVAAAAMEGEDISNTT